MLLAVGFFCVAYFIVCHVCSSADGVFWSEYVWCVGGRLRRSLSASLETGSVPALQRSGRIVAATAAVAAALKSRQPAAQYMGAAAAAPTCGALAVSSTIPGPDCLTMEW